MRFTTIHTCCKISARITLPQSSMNYGIMHYAMMEQSSETQDHNYETENCDVQDILCVTQSPENSERKTIDSLTS